MKKKINFKLVWRLLLVIESGEYIVDILKKIDKNPTNMVKLFRQLEENKLITIKKHNRYKIIYLTTLGNKIKANLYTITRCLK